MEVRRKRQRHGDAERVALLSGQADRMFHAPQRLIGVAQKPENPRAEGQAGYPAVIAIQKSLGRVLANVVERDGLLQVRP